MASVLTACLAERPHRVAALQHELNERFGAAIRPAGEAAPLPAVGVGGFNPLLSCDQTMLSSQYRAREALLRDRFLRQLRSTGFPCVGAKAALARDQIEVHVARDLTSAWDDLRLYRHLRAFAADYTRRKRLFSSFAVIFDGPRGLDEAAFERHLWERLQSLHDKDRWHGQRHDDRVDADPASPHFGMSFGGEAFFVVGLHPKASRAARRFPQPVLVFNLHDQFERLRADGRYQPMRKTILDRDTVFSGSVNPMLAVHGSVSEARQYSGRVVDAEWRCPFRPHLGELDDAA